MGALATIRDQTAPGAEATMNAWWLGSAAPGWLEPHTGRLHVLQLAEDLPPRGVDLIGLSVRDETVGCALLDSIQSRCGDTSIVVELTHWTPDGEAALLDSGASCVLDARCSESLRAARLRRLVDQARSSAALRRSGQMLEGDGPAVDSRFHRKRLMALTFASRLLTTVHDEEEIFQRLVEIVARELHSGRVSLMHVNRELGVLEMRSAVGISREVMLKARPALGQGIAGTCALLGKPMFIDDHARLRSAAGADLTDYVHKSDGPSQRPLSLTVPIKVKGEVVGVVNVTDRAGHQPYTHEEIGFIQALLGQAGYLLENAALLSSVRQARAFSERVLNTIQDPLVVVDDALGIVSLNQNFESSFGGRAGEQLWDRVEVDDDAQAALAEAMLDGRGDGGERPLGEWRVGERMFEAGVTPFSDSERPRYLLFLRDVTSRRQMERRLMGAEKMASLGVLAAGVAHEINNPLAVVKSNTRNAREYFNDLLEVVNAWREAGADGAGAARARKAESDVDLEFILEDAPKLLDESVGGIDRVERIVSGLKSFAHPDTQKAVRSDLRELVDNAAMLTRGKWKYSCDLDTDFEDLPLAWCLPTQLEQVFMNLIVNAAQAMESWGTLRVVGRVDGEGVRLQFSDSGKGIPPEVRDRIFEPFFTTKDIGEGTGLGLAIAYNIIENHGGTIRLESEVGVGTTFDIWLPCGDDERPLVVEQGSRFRI